ncbi:hypothetical protein OS965_04510 [Streptomyces sp. H27-G5]|nr:hypothetical protein [Streptomyces sp. H27-G5]MCY0917441.1 hypothetical protein [Streptomyces sp. H27-G5]
MRDAERVLELLDPVVEHEVDVAARGVEAGDVQIVRPQIDGREVRVVRVQHPDLNQATALRGGLREALVVGREAVGEPMDVGDEVVVAA